MTNTTNNESKATIQNVLDLFPGRAVPKCPLTFLVYEPGQIVPAACVSDTRTPVDQDCTLHAIESEETFAHDGENWRLVGTTAHELAAYLLTELVK